MPYQHCSNCHAQARERRFYALRQTRQERLGLGQAEPDTRDRRQTHSLDVSAIDRLRRPSSRITYASTPNRIGTSSRRAVPRRTPSPQVLTARWRSCSPGERRALVRTIALSVEALLGFGSVFPNGWFEHHIAVDDADLVLPGHLREALSVMVRVSSRYGAKSVDKGRRSRDSRARDETRICVRRPCSLLWLLIRVGDEDIAGVAVQRHHARRPNAMPVDRVLAAMKKYGRLP